MTNPADWLIAHRGYPAKYPENTLVGIRAALEGGARHVEFDVHLSADHQPVCIHDADLHRTAGRKGRVFDLPLAELEGIDVSESARFDEEFAGTHIASLATMLAAVADFPGALAWVELKRDSMRHFGRDAVIDAVAPLLTSAPCPVVGLSFDSRMLAMLRERTGLPIGWVFSRWSDAARNELAQLAPEFAMTDVAQLPPAPGELWEGPWQWAVYDVEDVGTALQLRERSVDLVETDFILDFLHELASRS